MLPGIIFIFDCWFDLKRLSKAEMDVGYDFIGFVKTNTDFKKGNTKNLTKDWPVVSYLALKRNSVVPGDR